MEKYRLDVLLFNLGLAKSREKAKQLIASNMVYVNDKLINKPSIMVEEYCSIRIDKADDDYVSRGAYKLKKAADKFNIDLTDKVCVDVGASTGGFTDFMLKNGSSKVYAIDVGHSQLAGDLINDKRVVSIEKRNFICIDVSFISLELILPKTVELCNEMTEIVALVKPQFEAGKDNIGKNGIVKDKKMHISILNKIYSYCCQNNLYINDITFSPITGGDGNIEYLIFVKRRMNMAFENNKNEIFKNLVIEAFDNLIKKHKSYF